MSFSHIVSNLHYTVYRVIVITSHFGGRGLTFKLCSDVKCCLLYFQTEENWLSNTRCPEKEAFSCNNVNRAESLKHEYLSARVDYLGFSLSND